METISCIALFDELEKIAEERRRYIDKDVLKQHAKAVAIVGAGMAAGAGLGGMARRSLVKNKGRISTYLKRYPTAAKLAPIAIGALAASPLALSALHTKASLAYTGKGKND